MTMKLNDGTLKNERTRSWGFLSDDICRKFPTSSSTSSTVQMDGVTCHPSRQLWKSVYQSDNIGNLDVISSFRDLQVQLWIQRLKYWMSFVDRLDELFKVVLACCQVSSYLFQGPSSGGYRLLDCRQFLATLGQLVVRRSGGHPSEFELWDDVKSRLDVMESRIEDKRGVSNYAGCTTAMVWKCDSSYVECHSSTTLQNIDKKKTQPFKTTQFGY